MGGGAADRSSNRVTAIIPLLLLASLNQRPSTNTIGHDIKTDVYRFQALLDFYNCRFNERAS
jgi:hypothetical protein